MGLLMTAETILIVSPFLSNSNIMEQSKSNYYRFPKSITVLCEGEDSRRLLIYQISKASRWRSSLMKQVVYLLAIKDTKELPEVSSKKFHLNLA